MVGVLIDSKDVLVNRMFLYDGGTITRPYDHETEAEALAYYQSKVLGPNPVLFHQQDQFEKALEQAENRDRYNEVLARMRWNLDGSSKIVIASNTFAARLLAQEYSSIMYRRLQKQAKENNTPLPEDYVIQIVFYMPGHPKHMQPYTREEQLKDKSKAKEIFDDPELRKQYFENKQYEFIFGLERKDLSNTVPTLFNNNALQIRQVFALNFF